MTGTEVFDFALKYFVLPVGAFVWGLHVKVQKMTTDVAVLTTKLSEHERARAESERKIEASMNRIMEKLDSIEEALRK